VQVVTVLMVVVEAVAAEAQRVDVVAMVEVVLL
jgi:hypothetical protein